MKHFILNPFTSIQKGAVILLCVLLFTAWSCGKKSPDDGSELRFGVKVENASEYSNVVEVRLIAGGIEFARSDWKKGGFEIVLPKETEPPTYLYSLIYDESWSGQVYTPSTLIYDHPTLTISDKNVKGAVAGFIGFDKDGHQVAFFYLAKKGKDGDNEAEAILTYVDSYVTITGSDSFYDYSLNWEKGWNIWYRSRSQTGAGDNLSITRQWTTTPVSGLRWYGSNILYVASTIKNKQDENL